MASELAKRLAERIEAALPCDSMECCFSGAAGSPDVVAIIDAELSAVRAALQPFASFSGNCSSRDDDDLRINIEHPDPMRSTYTSVGMFREARFILAQLTPRTKP